MRHKTRLEIEMETLGKRSTSPLAKMSKPEDIMEALRKDAEAATSYILAEYHGALRKGADVADRGEIMKAAAESYYAETSPLTGVKSELAGIKAEIDLLSKSMDRMRKAMPAFRKWALFGIEDPAGVNELPPRYDPSEPVMDLGGLVVAERAFNFDRATGQRSAPTYTKFEWPTLSKQVEPDLAAGAVDAALHHRRFQRD